MNKKYLTLVVVLIVIFALIIISTNLIPEPPAEIPTGLGDRIRWAIIETLKK